MQTWRWALTSRRCQKEPLKYSESGLHHAENGRVAGDVVDSWYRYPSQSLYMRFFYGYMLWKRKYHQKDSNSPNSVNRPNREI